MAQDCIEAAENIALCVQHQKSIVDDILTVSKLESNLLRITPIPAQPIIVVQRSMAMLAPCNRIYTGIGLTLHQQVPS